jgi:hypothetical protein
MSAQDIIEIGQRHGIAFDQVGSGDRHDILAYSPHGNHYPVFVLENPDNGDGPSDPNAKLGISCYQNMDRWLDCVEVIFPEADDALQWLGNPDFRSAVIFEMASLLPSVEAQEKAFVSAVWSDAAEQEIRKQDFTYSEMAREILTRAGCELVSIPAPGQSADS